MKNTTRILLSLFLMISTGAALAETDIYFTNKTPYTLKVLDYSRKGKIGSGVATKYNLAPKVKMRNLGGTQVPVVGKDGKIKIESYYVIKPNQRVRLAEIVRGGWHLYPSTTYTYKIRLGGLPDNKGLTLGLQFTTNAIQGATKISTDAKATAYLSGSKYKWYPDSALTRGVKTKSTVGGQTFTTQFKWGSLNGVYHDLEFTLQSTGKITASNEFNAVQYNIQQRPPYEGLNHQVTGVHSERSQLSTIDLPKAINTFDPNVDVVAVNEAFTASLRPELADNMAKIGLIHHTDAVNAKTTTAAWSGGVMVFSRHPIVKTKDYEYKAYASVDKNAGKGVQYVQINKNGKLYNIFATHPNASYSFDKKIKRVPLDDGGRLARRKQFVELRNFIASQRIPTNQPVIIVGDMNVDMITEKGKPQDEYADMLKKLNAVHPAQSGYAYTYDPVTDEWTVPKDPNSSDYLPPAYLDYFLFAHGYQQPTSANIEAICLKSNGQNACRKGVARDLSDHYPIQLKAKFPQ